MLDSTTHENEENVGALDWHDCLRLWRGRVRVVRSVGVSEDDGGGQDASACTGSGPSSVAVHAPTQGMTSINVGTQAAIVV